MSSSHTSHGWAVAIALVALGATTLDRPALAGESEAVRRLQEYVRVDTINPPGNETRGAEYFARIFERAGIEYETAESAPGRGNVWARLEGGDKPAIVLLHHMDVVPANEEHWTVDPLGAEIRDGYLYGRGTLDTKTSGILHLEAVLALHAAGRPLNRDVIFMGTADEEAGGFFGAGWLAENRPELFEGVGFVLNEGGGGSVTEGSDGEPTVRFEVEVTQKVPLWLRLVAVDEPGHGSMPRVTSSVTRLVEALARISQYEFAPRVVPAVDAYFKAIAPGFDEPWRGYFSDLGAAFDDPSFLLRLQLFNPFLHALTRNTCSLTMLTGSSKINVVPPQASAELDCRLLPDQDLDAFEDEIRWVINDSRIAVERIMGFTPAVSTTDTELFAAIGAVGRRHFPGAAVVPSVLSGFTDSHFFRDMGIVAYGFQPIVLEPGERGRVHGNDERVKVESVDQGVEMMRELLEELVYD
jgi:acetylornithine deacetylase/succinyl-diaminopimelate desuccinylase-like protein